MIRFLRESAISTLKQSDVYASESDGRSSKAVPGLLLVFSGSQPLWSIVPLETQELEIGRDSLAGLVHDAKISRRHVRVSLRDGRFYAVDLGSLNGTSVDGKLLAPNSAASFDRCVRIGETLLLACADVSPLERHHVTVQGDRIIGPRLLRVYMGIARLARSSSTLYVTGESGSGKEDAARAFHAANKSRGGPFIAVNCATIPETLAERLLFGARRGAFSGAAADTEGFIQAAHGGTLFLDEVAELHAAVQAKLLRVLESREVQALGAVRATPVDIRVCSASHAALRSQVAAGRLREDLYYRIGRPEITIPPLRDRAEEIPWLIRGELQKLEGAPTPHFSFVEACLLRPWPGNIRELLVEVRAAAQAAIGDDSLRIEGRHLGATAGQLIMVDGPPAQAPAASQPASLAPSPQADRTTEEGDSPSSPSVADGHFTFAEVQEILLKTGGNVSNAARVLGIKRNALRRLMTRYEIDRPSIVKAVASRARRLRD